MEDLVTPSAPPAAANTRAQPGSGISLSGLRKDFKIGRGQIAQLVSEHFDLRPGSFREELKLHRPIYQKTAAYGHFGREDPDFTWEDTGKAAALRDAAGLSAEVLSA